MDEDDNPWRPVARATPQSPEQLTRSSAVSQVRNLAAAMAAKVLLGCYRSGEANDPEVYITAVVATLAQYPEHVIRAVCDPRTGLPSRSKWLPTVSEVREECDVLCERDRRAGHWEALAEQTLRERREAEAASQTKLSYEEMKAKYGENWGLKTAPGAEEAAARQRRLDAIEAGNRLVLERECGREVQGLVISPTLAQLVRSKSEAA